jgi:hypothetical protein
MVPARKKAIYRAVFAARPRVYVGPFHLNSYYVIFRITRITPRVLQPLARVASAIAKQLAEDEHRQALARFTKALWASWVGRTDCSAGYVVQECSQYRGARTEEQPGRLMAEEG